MDPFSQDILAGLTVEAVKGLLGRWSTRHAAVDPVETDRLIQTISGRVGPHALMVLDRLSAKAGAENAATVGTFLHSPQFRSFGRNVAVAVLTQQINEVRHALGRQLKGMLSWHLGLKPPDLEIIADTLLLALIQLCSQAASQIQDADGHEFAFIREQASLELLAGRLGGIADQAEVFSRCEIGEVEALSAFVDKYSSLVHAATAEITPASFDTQKRVPIEAIYIAPRFRWEKPPLFQTVPADEDELVAESGEVALEELAGQGYRLVVLGAPGAGKSTLVQRLTHDLTKPLLRTDRGDRLPFVVTLRRFEERKRQEQLSIVDYLCSSVREELQLEAPASAIEFLMATDRAVVIFDGLDELLETHRRVEMSHAIEAFSRAHPTTSIIVTSRIVGYREAPLDPKLFKTAHLLPFTPDNVATYSTAWFALDSRLSPRERDSVVASFLAELESVNDLSANPLMLGLLCNVYRGVRSIPRSRADLYEQCAMMLFDRWDSSRGIASVRVMRSVARGALQDIALWIYTETAPVDGVPEHRLRDRIAKRWLERRLEDEEQAADEAAQLVESWRGRAWVLTDTGLNSAHQRLYSFTHQTFLEYFASIELVRRNPSPKQLWDVLQPHVANGEWDMVAQLSFQILDQNYDGAMDELFHLLCVTALRRPDQHAGANLLAFAARYAEAMSLGPKGCREIVAGCIDLEVNGYLELSDGSPLTIALDTLPDPRLAADAALARCAKHMEAEPDAAACAAFIRLADLASPFAPRAGLGSLGEGRRIARVMAAEALANLSELVRKRIAAWTKVNVRAVSIALSHNIIDTIEFCRVARPNQLFHVRRGVPPYGSNLEPVCHALMAQVVDGRALGENLRAVVVRLARRTERAYDHYLRTAGTGVKARVFDFDTHMDEAYSSPEEASADVNFGLAVLACGMHERDLWAGYRSCYVGVPTCPPVKLTDALHATRIGQSTAAQMEQMRDQLDDGGFTASQKRILTAWTEGRVQFIGP